MRAERNDFVSLWDMSEACREIAEFTANKTEQDYARDKILRAAVERKVEIIGEAARLVSDTFKKSHAEIPWRAITAQRHRLAHEYGDIDDQLIWKVATIHVPALLAQLRSLLPPIPQDEGK